MEWDGMLLDGVGIFFALIMREGGWEGGVDVAF